MPSPSPLRCVIDAMIFDAIAATPGCLVALDRLTRAGTVELLTDAGCVEQVAATPDLEHRAQLRRVRVLVVPPVPDADPVRRALAAAPGVDEQDARVGAVAWAQRVPLVTADRALRAAARHAVPALDQWTWEEDLGPRLGALAQTLPPAPRRRGR